MPVIVIACVRPPPLNELLRRWGIRDSRRCGWGESRGSATWLTVIEPPAANRLRSLPLATIRGRRVHIAVGFRARLLGLAFLDRADAGSGLLIPRCSSVHTFGMRFPLDLVFLDERGELSSVRRGVPPRLLASDRRAVAVLELPSRDLRL